MIDVLVPEQIEQGRAAFEAGEPFDYSKGPSWEAGYKEAAGIPNHPKDLIEQWVGMRQLCDAVEFVMDYLWVTNHNINPVISNGDNIIRSDYMPPVKGESWGEALIALAAAIKDGE